MLSQLPTTNGDVLMAQKSDKTLYVCLEGIDCTGKSELAKHLSAKLKEMNLNHSIVASTKQQDSTTWIERFFARHERFLESRFWRAFLYAHRSNKAARLANWSGDVIIGDRSIVTPYVVRWSSSRWRNWLLIRFVNRLERRLRSPDYIFYLEAESEVPQDRMKSRGTKKDVDETPEHMARMEAAYKEIMKEKPIKRLRSTQWIIVDANGDITEVGSHLFKLLMELDEMKRLLTNIDEGGSNCEREINCKRPEEIGK